MYECALRGKWSQLDALTLIDTRAEENADEAQRGSTTENPLCDAENSQTEAIALLCIHESLRDILFYCSLQRTALHRTTLTAHAHDDIPPCTVRGVWKCTMPDGLIDQENYTCWQRKWHVIGHRGHRETLPVRWPLRVNETASREFARPESSSHGR